MKTTVCHFYTFSWKDWGKKGDFFYITPALAGPYLMYIFYSCLKFLDIFSHNMGVFLTVAKEQ